MKLFTTTVGDGESSAVLIHGLMGDSGTWFELAPWIADHGYTVTMVDLRGHGRSDRSSSYTTEDFAADLVETLPDHVDLIGGHSLGGRVLLLAVDRLMPGKALYLDPGWVIPEDLVLARPARPDGSPLNVDELAALFPAFSRTHVQQALRSIAAFDPHVLDFALTTLSPPVGAPVVPSLVVAADPSPFTPPVMQERLRSDGYAVTVIPGGQHDLHITDLAAVKRVLGDWL